MEYIEKIKPLKYSEENSGKLIGLSKKRYTWEFEHVDHTHALIFEISIIRRKFEILFDDKPVAKGTKSLFELLDYQASIHNLHFIIVEKLFSFDLYINHQLFRKDSIIKIKDEQMTKFLFQRQSEHRLQTSYEETERNEKASMLENSSNMNISGQNTAENHFKSIQPESYKRQSTNERPFVLPKSAELKSPLQHRVTFPTKNSKISEFGAVDRHPQRKTENRKPEQVEQHSTLIPHKVIFPVLSQYEILTEKYNEGNFHGLRDEERSLFKLLYIDDK
jgi:hypothetical protein